MTLCRMEDLDSRCLEFSPHAYQEVCGKWVDRHATLPTGKTEATPETALYALLGFTRLVVLAIIVAGFVQLSLFSSQALAAQRRYAGVEITVGVMAAPAIGNPAKAHAKTWEEATGGKVRIIEYPYNELFCLKSD
jgi:hypothetical protein